MAQDFEIYQSDLTDEQMDDALHNAPPRISELNGHWEVWDVENQIWTDTGTPAQGNQGAAGLAPRINSTNKHWEVYNNATETWTDTGVSAVGEQGEKGDDGEPAKVTETKYGVSSSSQTQPTTWQDTIPTLQGGQFLWTRFKWNNNTYSYVVARQGVDGSGTGDMSASDYDPNGDVLGAGGIPDYVSENASAKAVSFSVTLDADNWANNSQTISDAKFVVSGYDYIVVPSPASKEDWQTAEVKALDVTVAGEMTFNCVSAPTTDITVYILKVQVA